MNSPARFNMVPSGRRSYKTENAKRKLILGAPYCCIDKDGILREGYWPGALTQPGGRFAYCAPTRDQAERIAWQDLKDLTEPFWTREPLETKLRIFLPNDAEIHVVGMDNPKRIEGTPWHGVILDEFADMKPEAWVMHLRPALTGAVDMNGWCDFIGVPEGRNHYYGLYRDALRDMSGSWRVWSWKSSDVLPAAEIESARRDLGDREFRQEYEAEFLGAGRLAYYAFGQHNIAQHEFNPAADTFLCFDFNATVKPFSLIVVQQTPYGYHAVHEFVTPFTQTETACMRADEWLHERGFSGRLCVRGDHSGTATRSTATVSDYNIIERVFGSRTGFEIRTRPTRKVKDRVASMNALLRNAIGESRFTVDPNGCPRLVEDFEQTEWLENETELDGRNPVRTHPTDAVSYLAYYDHPTDRREVVATIR